MRPSLAALFACSLRSLPIAPRGRLELESVQAGALSNNGIGFLLGGGRPAEYTPAMRSVAYVRVSTSGQDTEAQRQAIAAAAAARGDEIARWYDERAGAGSTQRAELRQLRADVRAGQVQRVYVFRLDRLARSGVRDTFHVLEELKVYGCSFVSVADGLPDVAGPWGDVVIAVLAAAAEIELEALRKRLAVARAKLEKEGRKWGRPPRLTRADYPKLLQLAAEGYTVRRIAMAIKVPRSTVAKHLAAARAA